jgi:hypothetical protein
VRLLEPKVDFSALVDQPLFRDPQAVPYSKLILRTPKLRVTDADGKVVFKGRMTHPLPFAMYPDEKEFYSAVADYIVSGLGLSADGWTQGPLDNAPAFVVAY